MAGMKDVNPDYDAMSEDAQRHADLAAKLYNESINPQNITMGTIKEAVDWGYNNETKDMIEISESIMTNEHYVGSCLVSLVQEYLWAQAQKESQKEIENEAR